MAKYHINDEGKIGICRASKRPCRFGGSDGEQNHFSSQEEAREYQESHLAEEEDLFAKALRKNPKIQKMEQMIKAKHDLIEKIRTDREELQNIEQFTEEYFTEEKRKAHNDMFSELDSRATNEERDSIYRYTGISYSNVNKILRDRENFIETYYDPSIRDRVITDIDQDIQNIDSYIAKAPKIPKRVFRVISQEIKDADVLYSGEDYAASLGLVEGQTVSFPNYSSTTSDPSHTGRWADTEELDVVLIIDTDEGAPVGIAKPYHERTHTQEAEAEILLPRDTQYAVTSVTRAKFSDPDGDVTEPVTVYLRKI